MLGARPVVGWLCLVAAVAPLPLTGQIPSVSTPGGALSSAPPLRGAADALRSATTRHVPMTLPMRTPSQAPPGLGAARPMLYSAVVPGAGQLTLGQRRGWAYLVAEALGWAVFFDRRGAGADFRDRYRDLAWEEARIQSGARVDGSFEYYETLTQWSRSGAFDVDPMAPGVQPEADPATFNGSIWARAAAIFLPGGTVGVMPGNPQYQSALGYYQARAYRTDFLWDWTGTGSAQDDFAELIVDSDDRFRQATNALGLVLANHVISAVDAYLGARRRLAPVEIRVGAAPSPAGARWATSVRVPVGR